MFYKTKYDLFLSNEILYIIMSQRYRLTTTTITNNNNNNNNNNSFVVVSAHGAMGCRIDTHKFTNYYYYYLIFFHCL